MKIKSIFILVGLGVILYLSGCSKQILSLEGIEAGRNSSVVLGKVNSISNETDGSLKIDFRVIDAKSGQGGKTFIKGNSDNLFATKVFQNTFATNTGNELATELRKGKNFIANIKQNTNNLRQEIYIIKF